MLITIFNKCHFKISIDGLDFEPFKEQTVNLGSMSQTFRNIRCNKGLRVGKLNNAEYIKIHGLNKPNHNKFHFCLDNQGQHAGEAYKFAIAALANPIIKHLESSDLINRPFPGINCRFFSSMRINEQGKYPVGDNDIFISHGIADKNYWIGENIKEYKYAFVPGQAWENRMRKTGYKGEIFITGYTKLDDILNGEVKRNTYNKPYIAWCPTHGYNTKNQGRSSYPECNKLIKNISKDYITKIALHPTSKMNEKQKQTPTIQELVDSDVVIADAGSTLYEAWIIGKPVIFPDWICKDSVLNHFKNDKDNFEYRIYNEGIGYHARDMKELNKMIDIALDKGMGDKEKEFIENIYPTHLRGKAGKTAAECLKSIANIIST